MTYQEQLELGLGTDNPVFNGPKESVERNLPQVDLNAALTEKEGENRARWGHSMEFLMSCIAMSVGVGNIWRFPFTAYENGGGAFLIPYLFVLLVIGRPMYYMEMVLGQFTSRGNVQVFGKLSSAMKGVGYGQLVASSFVATYYCSIMSVTLFYLFNSFTSNLPWASCQEEWNVENTLRNITCIASSEKRTAANGTEGSLIMSSSELWFTREVLKEKPQIDDGLGDPEWRLTLCLLLAWIVAFVISYKGVKSSGKAAYFLAIFPYIVILTLLIRGVTLTGAVDGILYFIRPKWEKLLSADVWYAAVTQCFFSLNVGFGTVIMYSSYNEFEHNINRDALVVTTLDTFTSLLAGTTIFAILGNLAYQLDVPVEKVINLGGTGLAFISYPEAIAKFEQVPWLFGILFFVMLFVLGIGSLAGLHNCANTIIKDKFPSLKSWHVSGGTALVGFLFGLIYMTPGGQFMLTIVDHYAGTLIIFLLAVIEVCGVMWFYGVENFCDDVEFMLKAKVGVYWRLMWTIFTPLCLLVIFIYFLATLTRLTYGRYTIPDAGIIFGWAIVLIAVVQLFYCLFKVIYKHRKTGFPQMIYEGLAESKWGPHNQKQMEDWKDFKRQKAEELAARKESWLMRKILFLLGR